MDSDLLQAPKVGTSDSPAPPHPTGRGSGGVGGGGELISVPAVPHCGDDSTKRKHHQSVSHARVHETLVTLATCRTAANSVSSPSKINTTVYPQVVLHRSQTAWQKKCHCTYRDYAQKGPDMRFFQIPSNLHVTHNSVIVGFCTISRTPKSLSPRHCIRIVFRRFHETRDCAGKKFFEISENPQRNTA